MDTVLAVLIIVVAGYFVFTKMKFKGGNDGKSGCGCSGCGCDSGGPSCDTKEPKK